MNAYRRRLYSSPALVRGVTLIELMVALVLGLIVSGAALALFVTNKQTFTASESLGRIQEGERTAFELMARDVREGAGNACGNDVTQVNVINNPTAQWYTNWSGGIIGYDGGTTSPGTSFGTPATPGSRVPGTDAIELHSSVDSGINVVRDSPPGNNPANIKVNSTNHGLVDGDLVAACDPAHMAIFQITNAGSTTVTVVHNDGTGSPGNCSKGLGGTDPAVCTTNGIDYTFGCLNGDKTTCDPALGQTWSTFLAKMVATRWYVGYNARGGKSLYQTTLQNVGGVPTAVNNEITEGVNDMQLRYLEEGAASYADAAAGTQWPKVLAVNIDMTLAGLDRVSTDNTVLQRHLQHVVTLRNRAP